MKLVLVLDEHRAVSKRCVALVESAGFQVECASDRCSALVSLSTPPLPVAVVLNAKSMGSAGRWLLQFMKRHAYLQEVPVIVHGETSRDSPELTESERTAVISTLLLGTRLLPELARLLARKRQLAGARRPAPSERG